MILERYTSTPDGLGGYEKTWVNVGEFDGWIDQLTNEKDSQGFIKSDSTHILVTFDFLSFEVGDRIFFRNREYHVNWTDNPVNIDHHIECELKLVDRYE